FFFSSRRRHTRFSRDWSSDVCSSDLVQAALPILGLDTSLYRGWTQIVVYPGGFLVPRTETDEAGVVHEYVQETSGESWEGGPVRSEERRVGKECRSRGAGYQ